MRTISEVELRRRMASVLQAIARGEEFTITHEGEPVARIMPMRGRAAVRSVRTRRGRMVPTAKSVRVRPRQPAREQPVSTPSVEVEEVLERVKVRREELFEAMESARFARAEDG